ncbi:MAG: hypothetical protein GDA49_05360 [Rhodospirillales bacterium]|nr:hypothetical protein [Rhodospirillales bacterium]
MRHAHHVPISIGVALAAGLCGLYGLPQRYLEGEDMTGGWRALTQYIIPLVLMTLHATARHERLRCRRI